MQPKIEIIIPVYSNKNSDLASLLKSILQQDHQFYSRAIITVVLNPASSQQTLSLQNKLTDILTISAPFSLNIVSTPNKGVNIARQIGINQSAADIILFFDDDVRLDSLDLIDQHVLAHQENPTVFAFGGTYSIIANSEFGRIYGQRQLQWLNEAYLDSQRSSASYLMGGHFSLKRTMLVERVIEFDRSIQFGASETDFFLRAHSCQMELVLKSWSVLHIINDSAFTLLKKTCLQGRGKKYIESKGLRIQPVFRSLEPSRNCSQKLINTCFELAFNWGYFSKDKQYKLFFKYYYQNLILYFRYQNQKIVNFIRSEL